VGKAFHDDLMQRSGWEALLSPVTLKQLGIRPMWQAGAQKLRDMVTMLQTMVADGLTTEDLVRVVYDTIGYKAWLLGDSGEGVAERTEADDAIEEALASLLKAAARMPNPDEFLNFADQCAHRAPAARARSITLSTVHRAKGLEWPLVVVGGLVADSFPHKRGDAEEERRVFYVAITRAKERLLLSTHTAAPCSEFFEEGVDGLADSVPAGGEGPEGEPGEGGADLCAPTDAAGVDRGVVRGDPPPGEPDRGLGQDGDVPGSHLHGGRPGVAAPSGTPRLRRRLAS
jgi:DNA-directed RNA polymerase specialized sigma24 family protein